jgi:hypothetical protein
MAWCLIKSEEQKFRKALVEKKINPFVIQSMTSEERRSLFSEFVSEENAKNINSLYESKLLAKNQQKGFENWVKRSLGMTPEIKRDMVSKIERLNELGVLNPQELADFKEDMARTRLGLGITFKEAKTINTLAEERTLAREKWNKDTGWSSKKDRIQYGIRQVMLENYVNDLKLQSQKINFKENPILATTEAVKSIPSVMKSLMASLDNSFFGRQGIKNLFGSIEQKKIWARTFAKSFKDIGMEIANKKIDGLEPMDLIRADVYSRDNSINGKYKAGNYRIGVLNEEAFPTSLPERVPLLGRLFKASETAFTGGALRMRADLADLLIAKAEKAGVNTLNPEQARGIGNLVGSLTGRGSLGKGETIADELNVLLFSARFFKSNIDTLTAHQFDKKATPFVKSEARKNLLTIVANLAGILTLAKLIDPEAVDEDPRSTNFGKVRIFGKWVDISGGMRGIITPAARLIPTKRNGEWGLWQKSAGGDWTNLAKPKYGQRDGLDLLLDSFFLNKLAPVAAILRDALRGEMFGGEPFDIKKSITNSITPLSIQKFNDVKDEKFGVITGVMISEFFGLGVDTYKSESSWNKKTSKEMTEFKSQVGSDLFNQANEDYNRAYSLWFEEVSKDPRYKRLSDDGKEKLQTDAKDALKNKILDEYGYIPEKKVKTDQEIDEEYDRKDLAPEK